MAILVCISCQRKRQPYKTRPRLGNLCKYRENMLSIRLIDSADKAGRTRFQNGTVEAVVYGRLRSKKPANDDQHGILVEYVVELRPLNSIQKVIIILFSF